MLAYQKVSHTEDDGCRNENDSLDMWPMRPDKIRNEVIRGKIGVSSIENKIRYVRLRCFRHIRRRNMDAPVRRREKIDRLDYRRSRGRLKKNWNEIIRHDLKILGVEEDIAQDRRLRRSRIKVMDFR